MELVTTDGKDVEVLEPATQTTRTLSLTVKVNSTANIDEIVKSLEQWGEVTGVNYYQQTFSADARSDNYIY